jgi:hypothetical protein
MCGRKWGVLRTSPLKTIVKNLHYRIRLYINKVILQILIKLFTIPNINNSKHV